MTSSTKAIPGILGLGVLLVYFCFVVGGVCVIAFVLGIALVLGNE